MGRPSASPENRAFAIFFAHTVTKKSASRLDFVARSGPLSLFASFSKMFPAYARTDDGCGFRDGVTEVQLNKELQRNGFSRTRDRRTGATKKSDDPKGAGMYLFSHLQWKDPSLAEDREALVAKYEQMAEKFPLIMSSCKLDRFLDVISSFQKEWAISAEQMGEVELDEDDASEMSAQRSTSVSPTITSSSSNYTFESKSSMLESFSNIRALTHPQPLFHTPSIAASVNFTMPKPPFNSHLPSAQLNLSALQSQLTSSLLAVTLAKQQLQATSSVSFADMKLLSPFSSASVNLSPQQAMPSCEPAPSALSPFASLNMHYMTPMQHS